jgi:hypothetical protein
MELVGARHFIEREVIEHAELGDLTLKDQTPWVVVRLVKKPFGRKRPNIVRVENQTDKHVEALLHHTTVRPLPSNISLLASPTGNSSATLGLLWQEHENSPRLILPPSQGYTFSNKLRRYKTLVLTSEKSRLFHDRVSRGSVVFAREIPPVEEEEHEEEKK